MESALSWVLVGLRACQFAAALVLLGTFSFLMLLRRVPTAPGAAAAGSPGYLRLSAWTLAVTALTLLAWWLAQTQAMAGNLTPHLLDVVARETQFGRIMLWRLAVLALIAVLLLTCRRFAWLEYAASVAAAADLALLVWVGHVAAAAQTSALQLAAQVAHLLVLGVWIGGLPAYLIFLDPGRPGGAHRLTESAWVTRAFSRICTACVIVVVASGICNSAYLLHSPSDLVETVYGGLLLAKVAVLLVLLAFAADNLLRQRPRLERAAQAVPDRGRGAEACLNRLRRNVVAETALALAILALVSVLGMTAPPA